MRPDSLANFGDRARQVASLRVAADDHATPRVFAIHRVRASAKLNVGQSAQLDLPAVFRQIDSQLAEMGIVGARGFLESHEQIESPLPFENLRSDSPLQG